MILSTTNKAEDVYPKFDPAFRKAFSFQQISDYLKLSGMNFYEQTNAKVGRGLKVLSLQLASKTRTILKLLFPIEVGNFFLS